MPVATLGILSGSGVTLSLLSLLCILASLLPLATDMTVSLCELSLNLLGLSRNLLGLSLNLLGLSVPFQGLGLSSFSCTVEGEPGTLILAIDGERFSADCFEPYDSSLVTSSILIGVSVIFLGIST